MLFFISYPAFGLLFMLEDIYKTDDNMLSNKHYSDVYKVIPFNEKGNLCYGKAQKNKGLPPKNTSLQKASINTEEAIFFFLTASMFALIFGCLFSSGFDFAENQIIQEVTNTVAQTTSNNINSILLDLYYEALIEILLEEEASCIAEMLKILADLELTHLQNTINGDVVIANVIRRF